MDYCADNRLTHQLDVQTFFESLVAFLLVVDICCASFVATFAPELLVHFGFASTAAACALHLGASLFWGVAFVGAFVFGAAFFACLAALFAAGIFIFGLYRLISTAMKSCR